jgi:hypothetical protein
VFTARQQFPTVQSHDSLKGSIQVTLNAKLMCASYFQGMGVAKGGWYTEVGSMWPGQGLSLQVEEVLYKGRSDFQVKIDKKQWSMQ